MNIEDDLQRRFDSAGRGIDLGPGSVDAIKRQANRRTRRTRVAMSAAAIAVVAVAGTFAVRALPDANQTGELVEASQPENSNTNPSPSPEATDPRVTEADLTYVGAFVLPAGDFGNSTFAYGGEAAAFNPFGDPQSDDGFDGSLFVSGHPRENPGIAEVAIPVPVAHNGSSAELPVAEVLTPFADITDGRALQYVGAESVGGLDQFSFGGLEVADGPDGPRLHWSVWQYNNASNNDVPGHGHSSLDLGNPDPQGPWFLDGYSNLVTPGYVFTVPQSFADQSLDGNRFITGFKSGATNTGRSYGPPFFAYTPPAEADPRERLPNVPLALYVGEDEALAGHGLADLTGGAAWITTSDGVDAVVTVGRRGMGEVFNGPGGELDCNENIGWHAGPYEPQVMFYDPADLAAVADGQLAPSQLEPYRTWNPADHLVPTCEWELSSISFDAATGTIYVVQTMADITQNEFSPVPVVHVFRV